MSFDPNNPDPKLVKLFLHFGIVPMEGIPEQVQSLINSRTQAQPKTLAVLDAAGFQWDPTRESYITGRNEQEIYAFPQRIYLWIYEGTGKILQNTNALQQWLAGPNQQYIQMFDKLTGADQPVNIGPGTVSRPSPPTAQDAAEKILQTVKPGSRLDADRIIDIYKLAKETGNQKLMDLVKTLQMQESIKKSALKALVAEIAKVVIKEMMTKEGRMSLSSLSVSPNLKSTCCQAVSAGKTDTKKDGKITGICSKCKNHATFTKSVNEMTTTDSGTPGYNIPGWVSRKGGSKRGIEGSRSLGYDLTPIGKKDMERMGDKLT